MLDGLVRSLENTLKAVKDPSPRIAVVEEQLTLLSEAIKDVSSSKTDSQRNPNYHAAFAENATVQMHVASTLFVMLDALASSVRASYGMLFVFNEQTNCMVLVSACGSRYARPGSVSIPGNRNLGKNQTAESLVIDSGIALNIGNAYLETSFGTSIDDRYVARAMAGVTDAISKANVTELNVSVASIAALTSNVAKQTRTSNLLIFPVFKPGSHNSEVIGLLELGNKMSDGAYLKGDLGSADSIVPFSSDDECRLAEAAIMMANIMAKFPHDLTNRHNHDHGIDARLAQMMSGVPPPQYSISTSITSAVAGSDEVSIPLSAGLGSAFQYFTAGPLRTSSVRSQQLVHRSQVLKPTTRRADIISNAAPLVSGLLKDSNLLSPIDAELETEVEYKKIAAGMQVRTSSPSADPPTPRSFNPQEVIPRELHASLRKEDNCMPTLTGIGVLEVLENAIQMNESWRNAVALNIELDTEIRRLHEALRVSRREISRLQDMVSSNNNNM